MKKRLLTLTLLCASFLYVKAQTQVTFYTNLGNFQAEMYDSLMPITAGNFTKLTDSAYFDGIIFHRIIEDFIIQGGDPLGTGFGGPGYSIQDEFVTGLSNVKQTISMANSGPNTGGSQFFINLKNNTFLDFDKAPLTSQHPVFAKVYNGWSVVEAIENTPVDGNNKPITDVVMDSVRRTGTTLTSHEIELNRTLSKIYPNPVNSQSILDLYSPKQATTLLQIIDVNGNLIVSKNIPLSQGKSKIALSQLLVSPLKAGVYILTYKSEIIHGLEKFIVL